MGPNKGRNPDFQRSPREKQQIYARIKKSADFYAMALQCDPSSCIAKKAVAREHEH